MEKTLLVPTHETRIAALGGFLEGISYLNQDSRSDFASAYVLHASDDEQVQTAIQSIFSHIPGLTVRLDASFQGGMGQLEHDIGSHLLVNPHVGDKLLAQDMRRYLSFKVMDRLDDIINDWKHMDVNQSLLRFDEPKRFVGKYDDIRGQMIFYLLRSGDVSFVLYFCSSTEYS